MRAEQGSGLISAIIGTGMALITFLFLIEVSLLALRYERLSQIAYEAERVATSAPGGLTVEAGPSAGDAYLATLHAPTSLAATWRYDRGMLQLRLTSDLSGGLTILSALGIRSMTVSCSEVVG